MQTCANIIAIVWCTKLMVQVVAIVVHTEQGFIRGEVFFDYYEQPYFGFHSVPYAKPPLGKLRFQPPQKPKSWFGVRDFTPFTPQCVQPQENGNVVGQEDCLYLNVYTKETKTKALMPVIIYIHGGGFFRQSIDMLTYNPKFLITEHVVIVTINNRLGAFGFLTLDDSDAISANNGFRDQIMAMDWIKRNIASFGGNPNVITLSGTSAGGMSVHYHLFSPLSTGLFHKIICRSGHAIQPVPTLANNTAYELAKQLGISTKDTTTMIRHLQAVSPEAIAAAESEIRWFDFYLNKPMFSGLFIEKPGPRSFMPESPITKAKRGDYLRVPMMFSNTDREGLLLNTSVVPNWDSMTNMSLHIPQLFGVNSEKVVEEATRFYYNRNDDDPLLTFWGDIWFNYPGYRAMEISSRYQKIYVALFQLDMRLNLFKLTHDSIAHFKGACHTDDDNYIYYNTQANTTFAPDSPEGLWIRRMIRLQANFVKYSNPTPVTEPLLNNFTWIPYSSELDNAIIFTNENITKGSFANENYKFWQAMFTKYANNLF